MECIKEIWEQVGESKLRATVLRTPVHFELTVVLLRAATTWHRVFLAEQMANSTLGILYLNGTSE